MCKPFARRRVPPRHRRHQGSHRSPRVTRRAAATRRRGAGGPQRHDVDPNDPTVCRRPTGTRRDTPAPTSASRARAGIRGANSGPDGSNAEGAAQTGATGVRHVIAQPHRPGQEVGLHTLGGGPAVAGRGSALLRHDREETSIGRAVAARVGRRGRRAVPAGRRGRRRGHRNRFLGGAATADRRLTRLRRPAAAHGRELSRLICGAAPPGRREVGHHGEIPDQRQPRGRLGIGVGRTGAPARGVASHRHLLRRRATNGRQGLSDRQVTLRESEGGEVSPRRLLHAAENDADPHLAGTVGIVPPAEQFAGPPRSGLVHLDGLRLTGEYRCSVLHDA
jgi:hypothetical protein